MNLARALTRTVLLGFLLLLSLAGREQSTAHAAGPVDAGPDRDRVVEHWTAERRAQAVPRDLRVDAPGHGRLHAANGPIIGDAGPAGLFGTLGSGVLAAGGDTTPPTIADMVPTDGATVGSSQRFSATVTDASVIRSVYVTIRYPDGVTTQRFQAAFEGGSTWAVTISGFTSGSWSWRVEAKDGGARGGNTALSAYLGFQVDTGGGGGGGSTVGNAEWHGGAVQTAEGRIYFEMPSNARRRGPWTAYVCSGTVATDGVDGRSVVLTAAHCVYDDANKAFARNVLFIPDQADTTGSGTDQNCGNDPLGCWVASYGVVDVDYATRIFPDNNAWDYAYYVVSDSGAHSGNGASATLDAAAGSLAISFDSPTLGALGYSLNQDPKLMYCTAELTTQGAVNWWLPGCGLTGGASGGAWIQPFDPSAGQGPIVSVNSWGYTNQPGMAGPMLSGTSAACVFGRATTDSPTLSGIDGDAGAKVTCP